MKMNRDGLRKMIMEVLNEGADAVDRRKVAIQLTGMLRFVQGAEDLYGPIAQLEALQNGTDEEGIAEYYEGWSADELELLITSLKAHAESLAARGRVQGRGGFMFEAAFPEETEAVYGEEPPEGYEGVSTVSGSTDMIEYDRAHRLFKLEWSAIIKAARNLFEDDERFIKALERKYADDIMNMPSYLAAFIKVKQPKLYDTLLEKVGGDELELSDLLGTTYKMMYDEMQYDQGTQEDWEDYLYSSKYS